MLVRAAAIVLALTSFAPAADITYQFLPLQGTGESGFGSNMGLTDVQLISPVVTGSITTDGKLGTINASDILSWNISAGNSENSSEPVAPLIDGQITATPTDLEFAPHLAHFPLIISSFQASRPRGVSSFLCRHLITAYRSALRGISMHLVRRVTPAERRVTSQPRP